jgi:toxin-antitoxin system PIN domain toxin
MLCVDVNVLVDAFRSEAPAHDSVRRWLDAACDGHEALILTADVAASFLRVVTNRRIWRVPSSGPDAIAFIEAIETSPVFRWHQPGPGTWPLFVRIISDLNLHGSDIPDAYLAATALEAGAALVTSDRGFTRFRSLRLVDPSATP